MSPSSDFDAPLQHLDAVLRGLRAGRATPQLVENIEVDAYGASMRLKELASITTPDPRTIQVEPWDAQQLTAVEKAIATSSLGVNPVRSGNMIRVPLPPLTEERRQELTKLVRQHIEEARVSIRHTRERVLKELRAKKDSGEFSEDVFKRERKSLQQQVDTATDAAEQRGKEKEAEILTV